VVVVEEQVVILILEVLLHKQELVEAVVEDLG
jgi:hypothetical protein